MISTIVGAYRYTTKDGVDRINLTLSNEHEGAFGRPCINKDFNAKNFQTSSGEAIPFTEKIIGRKYLIDFGIFNDRESGRSITYPKSFDEVK